MAGELRIVAQLAVPTRFAPQLEVVPNRQAAALPRPGCDHELVSHAGCRIARHLEQRPAHPHDVAGPQRARALDALVVHKRPVRRAEVLDRERTVGPASDECVAARKLGIVPESLGGRPPDQELSVHAQPPAAILAFGHAQVVGGHERQAYARAAVLRKAGPRLECPRT